MNPSAPTVRGAVKGPSAPATAQSDFVRKALVSCGIASSLLYVFMNAYTASQYEGYSSASQTVSELSAIDAPTRTLWVSLAAAYTALLVAFGCGLWQSAGRRRALWITAGAIALEGLIGLVWPPMHQREVLAAGGGTSSDTMHIAVTMVWGVLVMISIVAATIAFRRRAFTIYSIATIVATLGFGTWTGIESPRMQANLPTPWIGLIERLNIGAYMLWVIILAVVVLRERPASERPT